MSRLFSHLENIGRDPGAAAAPQPASAPDSGGTGSMAGHAARLPPPQAGAEHGLSTGNVSGQAGNSMPLSSTVIPGYAIAAELALPGPVVLMPTSPRPAWTVRLWLLSLLALIGFSLVMLLLPVPAPVAKTAPMRNDAPAVETAPAAAIMQDSAPATALPSLPPGPKPPAATSAPRPVREAAPPAPVSAPPAAGSRASCSEAMAAMNLCSTPAR